MTRIDSRHVRILAADHDDETRNPPGACTRNRYEALFRRRRLRMPSGYGDTAEDEDAAPPIAHYSDDLAQSRHTAGEPPTPLITSEKRAAGPPLDVATSMIDDAVRNITVRALAEARRIAQLAQTVEQFCTDSSVFHSGQWDLEIELDPGVLPHTTLVLHVSSFVVHIRFHVHHPKSKRLISDYRLSLKRRLEKAMSRSGNARDVVIDTVDSRHTSP